MNFSVTVHSYKVHIQQKFIVNTLYDSTHIWSINRNSVGLCVYTCWVCWVYMRVINVKLSTKLWNILPGYTLDFLIFYLNILNAHVWVCAHEYRYLWRPEGIWFQGNEVKFWENQCMFLETECGSVRTILLTVSHLFYYLFGFDTKILIWLQSLNVFPCTVTWKYYLKNNHLSFSQL